MRPESEGGGLIGWDWAKPTDHIFYGTRIMDIDDDLDKWEGFANQSERVVGKLKR